MEFEVSFQDGIFTVVTRGDAELMRFRELLDQTFAHEEWQPGSLVLHDHSELNGGPLKVDDIRRIAGFCADSSEQFGLSRLAVVAVRDVEFGLARMWGAFMEGRWSVTAQAFRSVDEGKRWLLRPDLASDSVAGA